MPIAEEVWDKYKTFNKYTNPLGYLVLDGAEKALVALQNASNKDLRALELEAYKQQIMLQVSQAQARIAQELAISRRIDNAEEVEIEEFYDTSGKAGIGASIDAINESISANISGEGRKITKRIYRFKGWHEGTETITQDNPEIVCANHKE